MEGFSLIVPSGSNSMLTKSIFLRARAPGTSGALSIHLLSSTPGQSYFLYVWQLLKPGSDTGEDQVESCWKRVVDEQGRQGMLELVGFDQLGWVKFRARMERRISSVCEK